MKRGADQVLNVEKTDCAKTSSATEEQSAEMMMLYSDVTQSENLLSDGEKHVQREG